MRCSATPISMRLLLLLAIAEQIRGEDDDPNLVTNTYTTRGDPPPDRVPCMTNADCPTSGSCAANPFCPTDQTGDLESDGKYSCQEAVTAGTFGTPSNGCDNPNEHGFESCWEGKLKRYCSPRNREGGMYWTGAAPPPPAELAISTYTTQADVPPERVPCMINADCPTSASCKGDPYCATDGALHSDGQFSCWERITPGTLGTAADACDDPPGNGFVECWDSVTQSETGPAAQLKRYCSLRNRDGGMFWGGADPDAGRPPAPPSPPPPVPSPPPAPPDFSNSTEGQLIFGTGALVFMLLVGTVRSPAAPYPPPPPRRNLTRCALPLPSRCPHAALTPPSRRPHAALPPPSRYCPCPGGLPSPCPCQGGRSEDRPLGGRAQGPRRCGTLDRPLTRAQRRRAL